VNISLNLSGLVAPINKTAECITGGGLVDSTCVYEHICSSITDHFRYWGIALLVAYIAIDIALPLLFTAIWPKIALAIGRPQISQESALGWLKDRLLLAFAVFVFYQIFL
jgi:hypothetical protein